MFPQSLKNISYLWWKLSELAFFFIGVYSDYSNRPVDPIGNDQIRVEFGRNSI